jgi:hypothetical protein
MNASAALVNTDVADFGATPMILKNAGIGNK